MSDFVPETEENEEEMQQEPQTSTIPSAKVEQPVEPEHFFGRILNEKWYGRNGDNGELLELVNGDWVPVNPDDLDFMTQLWLEQEYEKKPKYIYNQETGEWVAFESTSTNTDSAFEDFNAHYQENYGEAHAEIYKKMDEELREKTEKALKEAEEKKANKLKKKAGSTHAEEAKQGWVDMGNKVHAVYVSNLPLDITEAEFEEFMAKCGVIQPDARTNKPKIKLYRDANGELKGDGRCCYIRIESIDLACKILDGALLKGNKVQVEEAHFEQKGDFDPTKKKRKLTAAQKKQYMESQNKIFEWQPEKPRNYRPKSDCTVILKNLFTLEKMRKDATLMMDLKEEMEKTCVKFGEVKKVVVYDNNPEGVVSVSFTTTDESDMAVKFLNGRVIDGLKITAELWDGKTKYKVQETAEDEERRRIEYEKFISGEAGETEQD